MREILFRGKRCDNRKWVQGSLFAEGSRVEIVRSICNNVGIEGVEVIPETVGQFTGLTDKNGKKIFEGDILYSPFWWWGPRFVYLMQGECGPCHADSVMQYILARNVENPENQATYNLWNACEVEIIGNIHNNPKLLENP